jgi:hypothetical protein
MHRYLQLTGLMPLPGQELKILEMAIGMDRREVAGSFAAKLRRFDDT